MPLENLIWIDKVFWIHIVLTRSSRDSVLGVASGGSERTHCWSQICNQGCIDSYIFLKAEKLINDHVCSIMIVIDKDKAT